MRPDVTALVAITNQNMTRGYHTGRQRYFVEAASFPCRWTESEILKRLSEFALEMTLAERQR